MNFLDTYDIARSATPNPDQNQEQPSLNEEVNQVIGQLGRFWGGFRKQSQQVLEVARKDFGDVVVQAQSQISKLTEVPETAAGENQDGDDSNAPTEEGSRREAGPSCVASSTGDDSEASTSSTPRGHRSTPSWTDTTQGFLTRLQSSLPPNIVSTVQNNIPESIKHASENIDFTQMRTNLLSDLQRVQGVTRAQAEEYFHKSEAMLKEAIKEAGDVLKDAVKVVPPEEADGAGSSSLGGGLMWDGTDMWMPYEIAGTNANTESSAVPQSAKAAGKGKEVQTVAAVATRAEALLKRLKNDPSILRHDPEVEDVSKDVFASWKEKEVVSNEAGVETAEWSSKIKAVLEDDPDGQALKQLEDTLVPSEMTKVVFWQRFFFRSYQIRAEEEKRKALIQSSNETDEEFSWEDDEDDEDEDEDDEDDDEDDEDDSSSDTSTSSAHTAPPPASESASKQASPGVSPTVAMLRADGDSRRVSSEDSFDLVSSASATASVVGDTEKPVKPKPQSEHDDDDEDGESDWE